MSIKCELLVVKIEGRKITIIQSRQTSEDIKLSDWIIIARWIGYFWLISWLINREGI